jgi:3-hydroxyisobutyrate dehydrogenase-like beta-hydroxyacid dehydrogenase
MKIGLLHPGKMGASVAATLKNSGCEVYWVSDGRSLQTRERAEAQGLLDAGTLSHACEICSALVSVCPPEAAEPLVEQVVSTGFQGWYLDANAIAPQRAIRLGEMLAGYGIPFVDGGIIGGPAWEPGKTWLYLSGANASKAAEWFKAGPLETQVISDEIGKASALKMCYAAYTKGSTALLCAILGTAEKLGVRQELQDEWSRDEPEFTEMVLNRTRRVTAKAWRFAGEMDEIAATFYEAGFPEGFHEAAEDIYKRLAKFKTAGTLPELEDVLTALMQGQVDD